MIPLRKNNLSKGPVIRAKGTRLAVGADRTLAPPHGDGNGLGVGCFALGLALG